MGTQSNVDFKILVNPQTTVEEADKIVERLKEAIVQQVPRIGEVLISTAGGKIK